MAASNEILNFAKLSKEDLLPASQALVFTETGLHNNAFRLLELNNDLLKSIENNEKLVIKGCDNDDLVICSGNSTYHVTCAETSNNLLLTKPARLHENLKECVQEEILVTTVCSVFQECLEANIGKCSFVRISELLKCSIYKGPEHESEIDPSKLFTVEELKNVVQASDGELLEALDDMDVFEINGYIRELDFEYHFRVLSYMLKLIDENSWALDTIDYDETCDALKDFVPEEVISAVFKKYTTPSVVVDGIQLYKYKERDVCQFFAKVILRTAGKFNLEEFLQAWKESVPDGMIPTEDMLYGMAIIDRKSTPKAIWEFEENTLPDDINERFRVLFQNKDKWTVPEIAPYIKLVSIF